MHRTERKTEQTRQPDGERRRNPREKSPDPASEWARTAEAILAGDSWEQLPAERIISLSGAIGNTALTELFALRENGPETADRPLPRGKCTEKPLEFGEIGEPLLVSPPGVSTEGSAGIFQPLTV